MPESTIATFTGRERRRRLRPRVERVVVGEVPLLRQQRVGRRERRRRRRGGERGDRERRAARAAHQRATTCGGVVPGAKPVAGRDRDAVRRRRTELRPGRERAVGRDACRRDGRPGRVGVLLLDLRPARPGGAGCTVPATCVELNDVSVTAGATRIAHRAARRPSPSRAGSRS